MNIVITVVYTVFLVVLSIFIQIKGKNASTQLKSLNNQEISQKIKEIKHNLYIYGGLFLVIYLCARIYYQQMMWFPSWLKVSLGLIFGVFPCLLAINLINYLNASRILKNRKNSFIAE